MSEEFSFGRRSRGMLVKVHPDLILVVSRGLLYSKYDFAVTEGARDIERQKALLAKGFSKTLRSNHLIQPDGFAHAFDVMAVGDLDASGTVDAQDRSLTWNRDIYRSIAESMKQSAEELRIGIRWGGDFKTFFDGPHFELYG